MAKAVMAVESNDTKDTEFEKAKRCDTRDDDRRRMNKHTSQLLCDLLNCT